MGKWRDFFKALSTNYDVMDDKSVQDELNKFMVENSDSAKRVAAFERQLQVETPEKKEERKKPSKVAMPKQDTRNKVEKERANDEDRER